MLATVIICFILKIVPFSSQKTLVIIISFIFTFLGGGGGSTIIMLFEKGGDQC